MRISEERRDGFGLIGEVEFCGERVDYGSPDERGPAKFTAAEIAVKHVIERLEVLDAKVAEFQLLIDSFSQRLVGLEKR